MVTVAGHKADQKYMGKNGYPCVSDAPIEDIHARDFAGVVIPGGFMPDKLRRDQHVLSLVREFAEDGKLVAAICHGGWIPISAGVYKDVRVTGSLGIKDDLINAGTGGKTRRWWSIAISSPAASPTICPISAAGF